MVFVTEMYKFVNKRYSGDASNLKSLAHRVCSLLFWVGLSLRIELILIDSKISSASYIDLSAIDRPVSVIEIVLSSSLEGVSTK